MEIKQEFERRNFSNEDDKFIHIKKYSDSLFDQLNEYKRKEKEKPEKVALIFKYIAHQIHSQGIYDGISENNINKIDDILREALYKYI